MGDAQSPPRPLPHEWFGSELGARVVSAVVLGAVALVATYQGGWLFGLLWLAAGVCVVIEWTTITAVEPRRGLQGAMILGVLIWTVALAAGVPLVAVLAVAAASLAALAFGATARDRLWAVGGLACATILVAAPMGVRDHPDLGIVGILWMFAVVWVTDIAAYFIGRRLGGPKLMPKVSPKKTWSGFFGGLIAGTGAGVLVPLIASAWGWPHLVGLGSIAALSAVASVIGQAGDLAESALKRHFNIKDSGHIIPGHGGVMDRLDAFWAVALLVGLLLTGARLWQ